MPDRGGGNVGSGLTFEIDGLNLIDATDRALFIEPEIGLRTAPHNQSRPGNQPGIELRSLPILESINIEAQRVSLKSGTPFHQRALGRNGSANLQEMLERSLGCLGWSRAHWKRFCELPGNKRYGKRESCGSKRERHTQTNSNASNYRRNNFQ